MVYDQKACEDDEDSERATPREIDQKLVERNAASRRRT
jgi:hypothetical protein